MDNIIILGGKGLLGGYLKQAFPNAVSWDREELDATNMQELGKKIGEYGLKPEAIINCVAFNDVDGAEANKEIAYKLNRDLIGNLAAFCKENSIVLVHFSSNFVFDDEKGEYDESSVPSPKSVYADSKFQGEEVLKRNADKYYLVRTSVLFGNKGESTASKKPFVDLMLDLSSKTDTVKAVEDEVYSVTYGHDLAEQVKWLLVNLPEFGTYHLTNSGSASWYDLAKEIFNITGKNINLVKVSATEFPRAAHRPAKSVLLNTKAPVLRPWQEALREYLSLTQLQE